MIFLGSSSAGKYFPNVEDLDNWHGKPLGKMSGPALEAVKKLITQPGPHGLSPLPIVDDAPKVVFPKVTLSKPPKYEMGQKVGKLVGIFVENVLLNSLSQIATRKTYGDALVKLGTTYPRIVALDGDTKNSTFAITYKNKFPERFIECFIAEQNMLGVGIGLACRDRNIVFVSAFAAFFTRAFDQIRMGAISQTEINCVGSHAGCSIGK